ncbi:sensor histidine kinase [Fodinicola acaciae]|uniref:sensor histidine kinase n=1 Tax=Fodinicola acaciae TaxID=2681555 RepID=UPI001C9E71AD|nr:sensor histidine kinase [Fodinicola acaciae]
MSPRLWSLARQLLVLQLVVVAVLVAGGVGAAYVQISQANQRSARDKVLAVAWTVARMPAVADALRLGDPSAVLEPVAEQVRLATGTDFVVVMSPAGIRYSHPNRAEIGQYFRGHITEAVAGHEVVETYTGTLGPSIRSVVPVQRDGRVVGLVSVGVTLVAVDRDLRRQLPLLLAAAAVALLLAGAGTAWISRWLRRQTRGLGPAQLARMYEFYDAVLHAVHEGMLLLDRDRKVQLVNDEARRLLDLPDDVVGKRVDLVGLPDSLGESLAGDRRRTDEIHLCGDRVLVVNEAPAAWEGRELGTVVTLRDHTDLQALTGELDSVRGFAESLRSQAHETANRLHTVISLVELGRTEQALDFAAAELAVAQRLTDQVVGGVGEPVLAALLMGKAAQASERGVDLVVDPNTEVTETGIDPRDLVTIVGNLLDNAIDAAVAGPAPRRVEFTARTVDGEMVMSISDTGVGLDPADVLRAFERGWSTKGGGGLIGRGLGLALAGQAVRRHNGTVEVTTEPRTTFSVALPA